VGQKNVVTNTTASTDLADSPKADNAVLRWEHGVSKTDAVAAIRAADKDAGYDGSVKWTGEAFEARSGPFASVVHVKGVVWDEQVVIEKCGGLAGGRVLTKCRELLGGRFPGGEVPLETQSV
jgi:hypothetical protein